MREPFSNIRITLNLLFFIEIILGMLIITVVGIYQYILSVFMVPMDRKLLAAKFFNTYILGLQLVITYVCSINLWGRIWCRRYSQTIEILLSVWLFFCFLIVLSGLATIWSLLSSSKALENNTEIMLFYGIDLYYMMPEWKLLWDQLQFSQECCGVQSYQDWSRANWMPKPDVDSRPYDVVTEGISCDNIKKTLKRNIEVMPDYERYIKEYEATSGAPCDDITESTCQLDMLSSTYDTYDSFISSTPIIEITTMSTIETTTSVPFYDGQNRSVAPYACCKHNSTNCYESYLPRADNSPIPHLNLSEINDKGCLKLFSNYMHSMLLLLLILILLAILNEIIICCLTKYIMLFNDRVMRTELEESCLQCCDDEGNALVVVQCPPNVKCITLEEQKRRYGTFDDVVPEIDFDYCDEPEAGPSGKKTRRSERALLYCISFFL